MQNDPAARSGRSRLLPLSHRDCRCVFATGRADLTDRLVAERRPIGRQRNAERGWIFPTHPRNCEGAAMNR